MTEKFSLDYAPAPESASIVEIAPEYGLYIDGEQAPAASGASFASLNPATEERLTRFAEAAEADVDRAVKAARRALRRWGALRPAERAHYLYRIARAMQERSRELAVAESLDGGKVIRESRDVDLPLAAAHFHYYAGWADKLDYAIAGPGSAQPVGVCAQVIPWNFPLLMLAWKIAPALAAGNTVVLKPAETTSLTALLFTEICEQAGLPKGVVNIVTGAGTTGAALVGHAGVDKVAFTGSTEVGRAIARAAAQNRKRVTLELGGKAANIVFADAALDQAVEGIINGIYFNQGHVCCAGSRLLVEEPVRELVVEKLLARIETLRVGDPLDKNSDIGAINSAEQLATITEMVEAGVAEGAEMHQSHCSLPGKGYWFRPTVFTGVTQAMRISREEVFGPVLAVQSFRTPAEAVEIANNTPYGLSAGVWTVDGAKILDVSSKLRAGVVWANTYNRFDPASPFGGYKESGFGREGGLHGLLPYLRPEDEHPSLSEAIERRFNEEQGR
jgi:aldehyde dehydrogenase (NAD+)